MPKDSLFSDELLDELDDDLLEDDDNSDNNDKSNKAKDTKNQDKENDMSKEELAFLKDAKRYKAVIEAVKKKPSLLKSMTDEMSKSDNDTPPKDFDVNKAITDPNSSHFKFFANTVGQIVNNAIESRENYTKRQDSLAQQIDIMKKNYGYDDAGIKTLIEQSKNTPLTLEDLHISLNKENIVQSIVENLTEEKLLQMKKANKLGLLDGKGGINSDNPEEVIHKLISSAIEGDSEKHKVDDLDITDFPVGELK